MRVAAVALLALFVSLFTIGPSGEGGVTGGGAPGEQEVAGKVIRSRLGSDEQNVRLSMPTNVVEPVGLAIWFHGQGGNVNDRLETPFLTALLNDGYAIASSDFHLQSWGNEASTEDTDELIAWAQEQTGLEPSLWVSGSMGGAISLNALTHGAPTPACWYGVKPAIELTGMQNVPTGPRYIRLAYDGDVPADRNPVRNTDLLPADVHYRVVASYEDNWVPIEENGGALLYKLGKRGIDTSFLEAVGPHEDPSHWNSTDLTSFADSCLPGSEPSTGTTEATPTP